LFVIVGLLLSIDASFIKVGPAPGPPAPVPAPAPPAMPAPSAGCAGRDATTLCCPGQQPNALFNNDLFGGKKGLLSGFISKKAGPAPPAPAGPPAPPVGPPAPPAPTVPTGFTFSDCSGNNVMGTIPFNNLPNQPICIPSNLQFSVTISGNQDEQGFIVYNGTNESGAAFLEGFGHTSSETFHSVACSGGCAAGQSEYVWEAIYDNTTISGPFQFHDCSGNLVLSYTLDPTIIVAGSVFCGPSGLTVTAGAESEVAVALASNASVSIFLDGLDAGETESISCAVAPV